MLSQRKDIRRNNGCWLEHPEHGLVFIENQNAFAREYKLNNAHISSVINEKRKSHKGWTVVK